MSDHGPTDDGRTALARSAAGFLVASLSATDRDRLTAAQVAALGTSMLDLLEQRDGAPTSVAVTAGTTGTVVEVTGDDRPFLFSTVLAAVGRAGATVARSMHPVLDVVRTDGRVTAVAAADGRGHDESFVRVELAEALATEERQALGVALAEALADLQAAEAAADQLGALLGDTAAHVERLGAGDGERAAEWEEAAKFCRWLRRQHFLALGAVRPDGTRVGVGADADPVVPPPDGAAVVVRRSRATCRVHRAERAAVVTVADPEGGQPTVVVGITTLRGRAERPSGVPWIRTKLDRALLRLGVLPRSHTETTLRSLFDSLPWDVLLVADDGWLTDLLDALLHAVETGATYATLLHEPGAGAVTAVAAVPAEDYRASLEESLAEVLRAHLPVERTEASTELGESGMVTTAVTALLAPGAEPTADALAGLGSALALAAQSWPEQVRTALAAADPGAGAGPWDRWAAGLGGAFREATSPTVAADDLRALDAADRTGAPQVRLVDDGGRGELRIVSTGPPPSLSDLVPAVESHGLVATEEATFRAEGDRPASVLGLRVHSAEGRALTDEGGRLTDSLVAVWSGQADTDALNRLVVDPGLAQDEVAVLRAYVRYLAQLDRSSSVAAGAEALAANPDAARELAAHFAARFAPAAPGSTAAADEDPDGRARVLAACDAVARLDHDRLLRHLLALVDATVRTNRWADRRGPALALQLDGGRLDGLGDRPAWREVWVSSPEVEGVHLRAGPIARGGLRWSDRADDVRTEVRQLMEAQRLKNALIVPTGAKGGFVVRHRPTDPAALRAAVESAYRVFVGALLDLTDNLVDGAAVRPDGVRAAAGDDPYLVVAADRGTATLSDLANSLAAERGFWLGDAFASGGSAGYDHKALGVTARGAWRSVTEHFARRHVDVARDPVRVVGIGDMSGDVFGNGLLRSRSVRLVAAFDHRHVLLDPDPDPARSFAERQRLFALPTSSWDDVDRTALSAGAIVHPRTAKQVELTPECQALLGTDAAVLSTPEVVRAVLSMPADLLYLGGIGTFVRAAEEPDAEVGDPANREVRVTADELGASVVGEGANLGLTARARVALAARGVAVNADAVDNSAGVDTSDHEVNLKILLGLAEAAGRIDRAARDALLEAAADDVVAAVLGHVAEQNRALTRAEAASARDLDAHVAVMVALVRGGRLDPHDHALPGVAAVEDRRTAGRGLYRPELAAVMAAEKVRLTEVALGGPLVDRPELAVLAETYVPAALRRATEGLMAQHPLRRQLVATRLVNEVVDRMGLTWVAAAARTSGRPEDEVLGAYWMARCTVDLAAWWDAVDDVPVDEREVVWGPAADLVGTVAEDFLRRGVAASWEWSEVDLGRAAASVLAHWRPGDGLGGPDAARPGDDPAGRADDLRRMALAAGLAEVAAQTSREPEDAVDAFVGAGDRFGIDALTLAVLACEVPGDDEWAMRLRMHLLLDLDRLRRACARMLLGGADQTAVTAELDVVLPHVAEAMAAAATSLVPLAAVVAELWLVVERLGGPVPQV